LDRRRALDRPDRRLDIAELDFERSARASAATRLTLVRAREARRAK
jgi:hypothetical protein